MSEKQKSPNLVVMFQDEGRFGTMTTIGRQWCAKGDDFVVKTKQGRENMYSYAAVSPADGLLITGNHEKSNMEAMKIFLEKVAASVKHRPVVMFLDRAAWHTSMKLIVPDNIKLYFLPPTSPQLNPVEHLWKYIRTEKFHNVIFDTISDVYNAVAEAIAELSTEKIKTLCACSYL